VPASARLVAGAALTRGRTQLNKLQAGHERCERLAAGSDGRATLAHELVRALRRARCRCHAHASRRAL